MTKSIKLLEKFALELPDDKFDDVSEIIKTVVNEHTEAQNKLYLRMLKKYERQIN